MTSDEDDYEAEDVEPSQEDKEDATKKWFYWLSKEDREFVLQNQKRMLLDKMLQQSIEESANDNDTQNVMFQKTLNNYIISLKIVANGFADYFIQTVKSDDKTQTLQFEYEYYKNGKKIEPAKIVGEDKVVMVEKDEDD